MNFHVLTLFPDMVRDGLYTSILKRAMDNGLISLNTVNIRDYTLDKHKKTDDYPFGGGAGLLMQADPVFRAYEAVTESIAARNASTQAAEAEKTSTQTAEASVGRKVRTIYLSPQGRTFSQRMAEELSQEDPVVKLGKQYLFDGDKKGEQSFGIDSWTSFYTYLAGPMAVSTPEKPGKALFVIDMMEEKLPAEVRLYGMLAVRTSWPYGPGPYDPFPKWGDVWTMCYASKLPSSVTLYGSQTKDGDASWVEISHFEQDRRIDNKERWCERCNENGDYLIISRDALDLASPCFITLTCPAEGEKYRYLKVVVNEVFFAPIGFENAFMGGNDQKYVTVHELEVFTAKD